MRRRRARRAREGRRPRRHRNTCRALRRGPPGNNLAQTGGTPCPTRAWRRRPTQRSVTMRMFAVTTTKSSGRPTTATSSRAAIRCTRSACDTACSAQPGLSIRNACSATTRPRNAPKVSDASVLSHSLACHSGAARGASTSSRSSARDAIASPARAAASSGAPAGGADDARTLQPREGSSLPRTRCLMRLQNSRTGHRRSPTPNHRHVSETGSVIPHLDPLSITRDGLMLAACAPTADSTSTQDAIRVATTPGGRRGAGVRSNAKTSRASTRPARGGTA